MGNSWATGSRIGVRSTRDNSRSALLFISLARRFDLVLRLGGEVSGVVTFVKLLMKLTTNAVDHPPALHRISTIDFFRPPHDMPIGFSVQKLGIGRGPLTAPPWRFSSR